jgi:hypothetical protein
VTPKLERDSNGRGFNSASGGGVGENQELVVSPAEGFPEAFDAVVDGLRQLHVELHEQPVPTPIRC